jgi:hypothetical protein
LKVSLFRKFGALNSVATFNAFEHSLKKHGLNVVEHDTSADVAVIWSVLWNGRMAQNKEIWDQFRNSGRPVVVLEVGTLNRNVTWKVAVNGIDNFENYGVTSYNDSRRKLFNLQLKSKQVGNDILICCQQPNALQWNRMPPVNKWLDSTIAEIRKYTSRKIVVRPHPRSPITYSSMFKNVVESKPTKIPTTYDEFDFVNSLNNAWAVVNWSTSPALEAAIHGVPIFTGPECLSAEIANLSFENIENPILPNREDWYNKLTFTEWTIDEITKGIPLLRINHMLT